MWESWNALKERWFKDEPIDPVFEGIVRDFCTFDNLLSTVYQQVLAYMKGVEELSRGMLALADGIHAATSKEVHGQMLSDGCNFKEACNRIARADAPHSAVAKLQRDMATKNQVMKKLANQGMSKKCGPHCQQPSIEDHPGDSPASHGGAEKCPTAL
eukprot:s79_g23.t1